VPGTGTKAGSESATVAVRSSSARDRAAEDAALARTEDDLALGQAVGLAAVDGHDGDRAGLR
jgi:hypothetical protein